jgi:hypothetical protein
MHKLNLTTMFARDDLDLGQALHRGMLALSPHCVNPGSLWDKKMDKTHDRDSSIAYNISTQSARLKGFRA